MKLHGNADLTDANSKKFQKVKTDPDQYFTVPASVMKDTQNTLIKLKFETGIVPAAKRCEVEMIKLFA